MTRKAAIIPPSRDLVEEVADRVVFDGLDYSSSLVVFPGKRPAHFLRRTIARRVKSSYVPPVILSMEELVDRAYEQMQVAPLRKLEIIDAVAFLFDLHRTMGSPLGGKDFLSPETFFPLGVRIYRDLEELLIEQVEPAGLRRLEHFVDVPVPPRSGAGLQSLSLFYDRFYPLIGEAGFSSRSQRYRAVCTGMTAADLPYKRIIFAGFYALTSCEKTLFRELLTWENTVFVFHDGPGLKERLEAAGIAREAAPEEVKADEHAPLVRFYKSPDCHGQVFALSAMLKGQGEGRRDGSRPEETVIVLPSAETLFPLLYHALPLVPEEEYNISLGYPLERTPTWGFLNNLMQVIMSMDGDRVYIPDYLRLVLHPYTKNIYMKTKTEITRVLFHTIEELLLEDRTKSFVGLDEIEGNEKLYRMVQRRVSDGERPPAIPEIVEHLGIIHEVLIRRFFSFRNLGEFAEKVIEVLTFIYEQSSARLHPFFHPFAESFVDQLDLIRKSLIRAMAFTERNSYFHFLGRYVSHCLTPFAGTPLKGLQVLGFLETRNLKFRRVYLLDANEDVVPNTNREESLLPLKLRQLLGMPTYRERDMLAAYYFDVLVRGAGEVHIFYVENTRKEKSRFVERLMWEQQKKRGLLVTDGLTQAVGYQVNLEQREPQAIEKSGEMIDFLRSRTYDATSLDVYLHCPLRFYYRYVLRLDRKEEAGPGMERLDIGKLVHTVLHHYFERWKGEILTEDAIDAQQMEAIVARVFDEAYGPEPIGAAYLLKRQITRQMVSFLRDFQLPLIRRLPVSILHLEHPLETVVGPFRLKGVTDRIEKRGERLWVVDYKTGTSPARLAIDFEGLALEAREGWSERIGSLQLPFYLLLLEQTGKELADMDASFLLLGRARLDEKTEMGLFEKARDVRAAFAKAKEVIFALMREITDPRLPFSQDSRSKQACLFCDYQYLCGKQGQGR